MNLPDAKDPIIWVLLVVLVVALVTMGITMWQNRGLEADLARAEALAAELKVDRDALQVQRDTATAANANMARRLDEQSRAVSRLQADGEARQARAARSARVVLAERPRLPAGHGPGAMNAWLREQFAPQ